MIFDVQVSELLHAPVKQALQYLDQRLGKPGGAGGKARR